MMLKSREEHRINNFKLVENIYTYSNLIHLDHTIILKIQKQANKYEEKNEFTKTEDILSNKFVQVLSAERYRIGS